MSGKHLNGSANGKGVLSPGSDEHEEEDGMESTPEPPADEEFSLEAAPGPVAELCAACMRYVAAKYKVALDGSPETLSLVDQYVRDGREAMKERPESVDLVAPAVGAYLGEVMRQAFGATWFCEGSYESWRLYFRNVYLALNPIGVAREALTMQEVEGWNAHITLDPGERDAIEQRLAAMPDVDEEEYYLPTTRFDVITAIVETLRARAEAAGVGDVRFGREDYD